MMHTVRKTDGGFTLLELTIAVAMFAVILGATAQGLLACYVTLDMQNQRQAAVRHCTAVLSEVRVDRDAISQDGTLTFPDDLVAQWPDGAPVANIGELPNEQIVVTYTDTTANPLEVVVTSSWRDLRGRALSLSVSTLMTDT